MGMFMSPNTAAIMNSLPPRHRGAGSRMLTSCHKLTRVLSIFTVYNKTKFQTIVFGK
jgi:hypothetical protein